MDGWYSHGSGAPVSRRRTTYFCPAWIVFGSARLGSAATTLPAAGPKPSRARTCESVTALANLCSIAPSPPTALSPSSSGGGAHGTWKGACGGERGAADACGAEEEAMAALPTGARNTGGVGAADEAEGSAAARRAGAGGAEAAAPSSDGVVTEAGAALAVGFADDGVGADADA